MVAKHAAENWKGQVGDRWLTYIDQFEAMLRPIGEAAIVEASFRGDENVADIGCGGGMNSIDIARLLGDGGHVTGIDIAPQLIKKATERAAEQGIDNVDFECGDGQHFTPGRAPFDKVFSRFGVMFFDDTLLAFKNMRSWLKPGGEMIFATWAAPEFNSWMTQIGGITSKYVEVPPQDPAGPGPFRLADAEATQAMMEQAGFSNVSIRRWEGDQYIAGKGTSPDDALQYALHGLEIEKALSDLDEATQKQAVEELFTLFKNHYQNGSVTLQASALFVRGQSN